MSYVKLSRREIFKLFATSPFFISTGSPLASSPNGKSVFETANIAEDGLLQGPSKKKENELYPRFSDGPSTPLFTPVNFQGNIALHDLEAPIISENMAKAREYAPKGPCTAWGIPFLIGKKIILIKNKPFQINVQPFRAKWLIFLHTADMEEMKKEESGLYSPPFGGEGRLGEHAVDYGLVYDDGTTEVHSIKRRRQVSTYVRRWGENCLEAVAHHKPHPQQSRSWGHGQTRVNTADSGQWVNWLWAWENPCPDKPISGLFFRPVSGTILLCAVSAGEATSHPLRWHPRQKALLSLPPQVDFDPTLDSDGLLSQIQLDMGQVISVEKRKIYPNNSWSETYNNKLPEVSERDLILEFTAHPDARFHLFGKSAIPVASLEKANMSFGLKPVAAAVQKVKLRVIDNETKQPVAVKLHVHGEAGEYLAPNDRHRIVNPAWFEDYSVDFIHSGNHSCTYIPGIASIKLPAGKVFIEVSKGFEIKPVRKIVDVTSKTREITIELEKVLYWREKGWISADTHVHFLSPGSAMLEGAAEGVNLVNLLASQWGELMTNVGDFDGRTTFSSTEAGAEGEYLVRVGTENRQHVLGHISLLGYDGQIIAPMTTGGPDESAIGDPIEVLLTEWARQCKKQKGVVILPHFPNPRSEHAASIVSGDIDGVEMTSWGNLYGGIDPYSLSDWYRYLNCGYFVAAVGGTDKMSARTAVGTVRTYAKIKDGHMFNIESWKEAIQNGHTFVSYGPLMEFSVEGQPPGSWVKMSATGGTVDVNWEVASCTIPMTKVELVVNGEIREQQLVRPWKGQGHWSIKIKKSSWLALLIRGHYPDKEEIITSHSSPVMVQVQGSKFFAAADALTIIEQIEGAMAYLDTIGTREDEVAYKRMRMVLEGAHRKMHNQMHQNGVYHDHNPVTDHHK